MSQNFAIKPFDNLTNVDVYHILSARSRVFVVEQHCAYQDIDGLDFDCLHLIAHQNEALIGYCRIIPPSVSPTHAGFNSENAKSVCRIGRVLVLPEHRGNGLSRQIMQQAIQYCRTHYKKQPIQIAAQTYLTAFYASLGFEIVGNAYDEDGIEHIDMVLDHTKTSKSKLAALAVPNYLAIVTLLLALAFIAGLVYLMV